MEEVSISLPSISLKALPVWFKISMGTLHLSDGFVKILFHGSDLLMA